MRTLTLIVFTTAMISVAHADKTTVIRHTDGTTSTVNTNSRDTQVINSHGRGGAQYGGSRTHQEVVRNHTRSGSTTSKK